MLAWLFNLSRWESPTHRVVRRNQRGNGCKRASACWTAPSKDALAPLRPPSPLREAEPSSYPLPRPPRRAGAAKGIYANGRTRMAGRARCPAAPAPHLASGGPPAQKSRPGNRHRRSLGSRGLGGWEGLSGLEETRPRSGQSGCRPVFVFILSPHFGFYLPVPSHLLSISTGLTPYLHSRITVPFVNYTSTSGALLRSRQCARHAGLSPHQSH
ncbi:unnamed protein product, partial [Rangifer tarandus platyrhynchus]|uniref:Uncharacterized protein n=1 Tax=Rangifer tarandus platyrhynchus TaxID=3082113 RepID=A0AC59ZD88_RANTA